MEVLGSVLPIVIDVLLAILITATIVLVIKLIFVVDKTKKIVENVEDKVNSVDGIFNVIKILDQKIELIVEAISDASIKLVRKFVKNKKGDDKDE